LSGCTAEQAHITLELLFLAALLVGILFLYRAWHKA